MLPTTVPLATPIKPYEIDLQLAMVCVLWLPRTKLNEKVILLLKSLKTQSLITLGKLQIILCICTMAKGVIDYFTELNSLESCLNPSSKLVNNRSFSGKTPT